MRRQRQTKGDDGGVGGQLCNFQALELQCVRAILDGATSFRIRFLFLFLSKCQITK